MHLSADEKPGYERLKEALKDIDVLKDTFGTNTVLDKLKLLIQDSIHVEKMEIEHVQDNTNGRESNHIQQNYEQRPNQTGPPQANNLHAYQLQTWPHGGKTLTQLVSEIGEVGIKYLAQMPNTHPDDRRILEQWIIDNGIPF